MIMIGAMMTRSPTVETRRIVKITRIPKRQTIATPMQNRTAKGKLTYHLLHERTKTIPAVKHTQKAILDPTRKMIDHYLRKIMKIKTRRAKRKRKAEKSMPGVRLGLLRAVDRCPRAVTVLLREAAVAAGLHLLNEVAKNAVDLLLDLLARRLPKRDPKNKMKK